MRVLFVINTMGRGGAEIQVRDLALRLVERGHAVALVVLLPLEDFELALRQGGVETHSLGLQKGATSPQALLRLLSIVRRFRPDVIHSHLFAANIAARMTRALLAPLRLSGRPAVVCTAHSSFETSRRYAAYRVTRTWCDVFTFVSSLGLRNYEAGRALQCGTGRLLPNGVSLDAFRPTSEDLRAEARQQLGLAPATFTWLAAGSFRDEAKDFSNLLAAFAALVREGAEGQLLLAGEGRLFSEKQAEAERLGLAGRVHFLGLRSDVDRLMLAADAYVMSSAFEALPIVLLEAAATALPIIATDVGANADVIGEGAGVLVPPKNAVALAAAMRDVQAMGPAARAALGQRARDRVESQFDLRQVVERWEALYEELVGR